MKIELRFGFSLAVINMNILEFSAPFILIDKGPKIVRLAHPINSFNDICYLEYSLNTSLIALRDQKINGLRLKRP